MQTPVQTPPRIPPHAPQRVPENKPSRPGRPARPERPARKAKIKANSPPPQFRRLLKFDIPLFFITLVLCVFGLIMLLSASYFAAYREYGDTYHFFSNQLFFVAVGFAVMIGLSLFPYEKLKNRLILFGLIVSSLAMMLATYIGGAAVSQGGAGRWIDLGFVTFQPSEILKFALIITLAAFAHKYSDLIKTWKGALWVVGITVVACGLTFFQPHLSGTVIMFVIGLTIMFVGGLRKRYVALMGAGLAVLGVFSPVLLPLMGHTYSGSRFQSWLDPFSDITGDTFQTYQSLMSIGSGGWFGLGLGNSRQKFSYLPMAHNDFIFPVIVEELGFLGGSLIILLFVLFIMRGIYISTRAPDRFGMLVAAGITVQIGIQALLNIGVATNTVPNTGISLPFFSYGGTAIVMQLAQIGVLLNISRKARIE
ncbi:MAG: putative lipid II flippase FtsW [Oscillospiraceae bacterium]|nr:putative lipid II flippase FtsW [Oscillospiraceae bacterium]